MQGRLSEDTVASALSTTPTALNPFAYFMPLLSDGEEASSVNMREDVDALGNQTQPTRSRVDFADLCASLEDLVYLGEGSNGVVYSASWHGARVAVKFLLGNHDDSTHLQRCLTEAVLTRVLSHPCVVQCFATAISQLTPEVMHSIRSRCRRNATFMQTSSLGRSVAAAMQAAEAADPTLAAAAGGGGGGAAALPDMARLSVPASPCALRSLATARSSFEHPSAAARAVGGHAPPTRGSRPPSRSSQPRLLDALSTGGVDAAAGGSGTCSDLDERAILELQKVACMFGEEGEEGALGEDESAPALGPGGGGRGRTTGGGGGHSSCELSGDENGGVSLLQALSDLQAEAGRHCTLVVMEYLDAGTLHGAIVRGDFSARRCPEQRHKLLALLLTAQELAQGMAHLHALDILHGDLKPTNVLLKSSPCQYAPTAGGLGSGPTQPGGPGAGPAGAGGAFASPPLHCLDPRGYSAKIADLGLARTCPGETTALSSDQWGALAYLAPEAAKGSCCKASDVYSFGVMLWEMAAGVRPYLGLTTPQVLMGLVTGTLQLTWPSDGSLYGPLRSLAVACTELSPAERPTFEMAAKVLGKMVRHIRAAGEPLRQRHSSALSMEVGRGSAAAAAAAAAAGAASPGIATRYLLQRAACSMPVYMPAGSAGGAGGGSGGGGAVGPDGRMLSSGGEGAAAAAAAPRRTPAPSAPTMAVGAGTAASAVGTGPAGAVPPWSGSVPPLRASRSLRLGSGPCGGAAGVGGWSAAPPARPAPAQPYPRTRMGGSGQYCGVLARGQQQPHQPGSSSLGVAPAAAASAPAIALQERATGGGAGLAAATAASALMGRPGSLPAHAHVGQVAPAAAAVQVA